jgi:2-polyprenyl-3-methyl-5-hydroxy-6-metoxy-1,4-benzoquinol methylase
MPTDRTASPPATDGPDLRDYGNVAGNHYDKYQSGNPIARKLMAGFMGGFDALVSRTDARSAFEVGCGEGHLSMRLLERGIDTRGMDLEAEVVAEANEAARAAGHGERFTAGSVYDFAPGEITADLIVCCEVLEHLPDPARALDILSRQQAGHWLFSVPREPIWRVLNLARGKYVGQLGNTPGHLQHWSTRAFRAFVSTRFDLVELRRPLPWTMILCRGKAR